MEMEDLFYHLGDCAVVVKLGREINMQTHQKVKRLSKILSRQPFAGMIEFVPAYTTVTVYYDPLKLKDQVGGAYQTVCSILEKKLSKMDAIELDESKIVDIPVCYGEDFGPDLAFVANHNGIKMEEIIRIHSAGEYPVYMLGFVPGFPYLGGMSDRISAPRRENPRPSITAGSVGIAGTQTGIYPIESPGGWQIIGRTPLTLFQQELDPPSLLKAGDIVRFYPISREAFDHWGEETS